MSVTRRSLLSSLFGSFLGFFRRKMPAYPNQYDVPSLPYTHSGTLDEDNPDQVNQPDNVQPLTAEEQFFLPLTPGLDMEITVTFESDSGYELVIFWPSAFDHSSAWYVVAPTIIPADGVQRDAYRWTVPATVNPLTRLAILADAFTPIPYTIRIAVPGSSGPAVGSGYGAF